MSKKPSEVIEEKFPFEPTDGQRKLFSLFDKFLFSKDATRPTLMLKGYAGTGKTSVLIALVKALPRFDHKFVLLAPTGRAAKVIAAYTKRKAFTIHKLVYQRTADLLSGKIEFKRRKNYSKNTLFVVDESSMISDEVGLSGDSLLYDLITYVFSGKSNKLMLIGDTAQLPPVKQILSRGLDHEYLAYEYRLDMTTIELSEVKRQNLQSGILYNATSLRNELSNKSAKIQFQTSNFSDTFRMPANKLEDGLRYVYKKYGIENSVIVSRSNREAVQYNEYVRRNILFFENEIEAGDLLMVVKNNYYFLGEDTPAGFLANGDFVEILRVVDFEEIHNLRFATLEMRLVDYPEQHPFEAKVILDTLHAHTPALPEELHQQLYQSVLEDYQDEDGKKAQMEAVRNDMYLNALQVKFAYALTCHKSQGGQWEAVFVSQGYLKDDMIDQEYLRWLYTAITRAKSELFLMNFQPKFFI